jgi:hypothetical protein
MIAGLAATAGMGVFESKCAGAAGELQSEK